MKVTGTISQGVINSTISTLIVSSSLSLLTVSCSLTESGETQLTDYDGNLYTTVIIGSQEWTIENIRVKHYFDGTAIPEITNNVLWAARTSGAYCYYNNDSDNEDIYGLLYNGYIVNGYFAYLMRDGVQESGWRIPSNADWTELRDAVGNVNTAGGILKDTLYWTMPNTGAINSVGWYGRGGGIRDNATGVFSSIDEYGLFLSDPDIVHPSPIDWTMQYDAAGFEGGFNPYVLGRSVRLVRDI